MEIVIVVAIWSVIVKRGVEDILHTARGGTPHRYKEARKGGSGAWGRYWRSLSDDVAADLLKGHNDRRARRDAAQPRPDKPRGAATRYFAGYAQDGRRAVRRRWEAGWDRLDERRREKATRPRPGQQTVPGEVVPNEDGPQDETQDRPQDETGPDPRTVPTPDGGTDLQFGDDPTDPTGTKNCPECDGTSITEDGICLSCRDRQEQRNQHHDDQDGLADLDEDGIRTCKRCRFQLSGVSPICDNCLNSDPNSVPLNTQEGTPAMTTTTTEVTGLESGIKFSETSAQAYSAMVGNIEQTLAALDGFDVGGPARAAAAAAMEQSGAAAASMLAFAEELKKHRQVQEAIDATPGAGKREFYTSGR